MRGCSGAPPFAWPRPRSRVRAFRWTRTPRRASRRTRPWRTASPMVYLGTAVVAGSGVALVTATGLATDLGRIGRLVALAGDRATPLERQVEQLGRRLMVLALAICAVVGLSGILHGEPIGLMLETAISLAVAAIPEGLPAPPRPSPPWRWRPAWGGWRRGAPWCGGCRPSRRWAPRRSSAPTRPAP